MEDFYKNPIFYYIIIPILVVIWPLSIMFGYLPNTQKLAKIEEEQHEKAKIVMYEILDLDPGRLEADSNDTSAKEFDYATAIYQIATTCGISSANYNVKSTPPRPKTSRERKTQSATVILQKIDIEKFANFLSSIQRRWANLECESVDIDRQKGLPDAWKITLKFKYYY